MRLPSGFKRVWGVLCLLISMVIGCGRTSLRTIEHSPITAFPTVVQHNDVTIYARVCTHDEINKYFSRYEDFYHYYYLIQLRLVNNGYVRYTLQSDGNSFFIPPADTLRPYTESGYSSGGLFFSLFNAVLFFPVYAISMVKSAVENTPYLTQPDIVVPRSFGILSILYAGVVFLPFILGSVWEKSRNSYSFHEANRYVMTQRQQFSCAPFATENIVIMTPRAGFATPATIALYNHKTYTMEKVSLPVALVW